MTHPFDDCHKPGYVPFVEGIGFMCALDFMCDRSYFFHSLPLGFYHIPSLSDVFVGLSDRWLEERV